jgi:hypothetical protein
MTNAQQALLAKLPEMFFIFEDFSISDCPPTVVRDLGGNEIFSFGRGDGRTFSSLCEKQQISRIGEKESFGIPYGKSS